MSYFIYGMVRYRRFARRRARGSRRRRNYGQRKMLHRKRMTVRINMDYPLLYASYVPAINQSAMGTQVGNRADSFETWCINPMPAGFYFVPQRCGGFEQSAVLQSQRQIGGPTVGNTQTQYMKALTDLPVVITNYHLYQALHSKTMFELNKEYRLAWVSITFTIPENSSGQPNRHMFVEWTNLPHATPCRPGEALRWVLGDPDDAAAAATNPTDDYGGWNWICNPVDIASACSVPGKASGKHGWQRAMLTAGSPVTITWRPRHANIKFDHVETIDCVTTANFRHAPVDEFGSKWSRGYLPTHEITSRAKGDNSYHCWMGPVIRIVDADKALTTTSDATSSQGDYTLSSLYNIRCNLSMAVKFRKMQANDPYFPDIHPVEVDN